MDDSTDLIPLEELANEDRKVPRLLRKRDGFNRGDVVNAFANAFQIIGGVPRLALWANQHPDKFYALYARLLPSNTINIFNEGDKVIIEHAIGPTKLDEHPDASSS